MRRQSSLIGVAAGVAILFLVLPALANRCDAQVLQYVVRADPFEVQLTLPDGAKQTTQPRREKTLFIFFQSRAGRCPRDPATSASAASSAGRDSLAIGAWRIASA